MTAREKILLGVLGGLIIVALATRKWSYPKTAEPYLVEIFNAEKANGLPPDLLGRLLYQESRFRPDIISGKTPSPAGALGIAQIVPKWHPGVNPLDPVASIRYAAQFLASLKAQLGSWDKAVAGYNTGAGNVKAALSKATTSGTDWLSFVASETRNYVNDIFSDLGYSRGA